MVHRVRRGRTGTLAPAEQKVLAKTRLCRYFVTGGCHLAANCTFAHGEEQLLPQPDLFRTRLCLDFAKTGTCIRKYCKFAHTPAELRAATLQVEATAVADANVPKLPCPADVLRRQLQLMERQAKDLRAQLRELDLVEEPGRLRPARKAPVAAAEKAAPWETKPVVCARGDYGGRMSPVLSRLAATDYGSGSDATFARDCGSSSDEWEADESTIWPSSPSTTPLSASELIGEAGFVLVVRKTFLEVEHLVQGAHTAPLSRRRRASSAPPACVAAV